ncbi:MAG: DUF192 domain-containing protein [Candidatus Micrarchaeota archaeon]|nr:DUF192 domain-containing protein [Candidatus Micrarchaeota archaeon]MDE1824386.1 DUF192 domain-containing protein [Candidatus Micrarchaeota archaeon]MDE1849680.1 DUF192 domain-containing protein [Candidatus Micrarchaeota archaeon]
MFFKLLYLLNGKRYRTKNARIRGKPVRLYLADTALRKTIGLMYWDRLKSSEGMLFIFGKDRKHEFWMLNMRFPIDIIWLDSSRRIAHIVNGARPCASILNCAPYVPQKDSRYVLELVSGFARKSGMKIGDRLSF